MIMQKGNNKIESFFDDSWEHMHGLLEDHFPLEEKRKKRIGIWWWLGSAVSVFMLGWLVWPTNSISNPIIERSIVGQTTKMPAVESSQERSSSKQAVESNDSIDKEIITLHNSNAEVVLHSNDTRESLRNNSIQGIEDSKSKRPFTEILIEPNVKAVYHNPINKHQDDLVLVSNDGPNKSEKEVVEKIQPLKSIQVIRSFVKMDHEEGNQLKVEYTKPTKRRFYADIYTGVTHSFNQYNMFCGGLLGGVHITSRLGLETGLGYQITQLNEESLISQWDGAFSRLASVGPQVSAPISFRLHNLIIPLNVQYQLSPKLGLFAGGVYAYQFRTQFFSSDGAQENYSTKKNDDKSNPSYLSLQSGASYNIGRIQFDLGYRNRAFPSTDHQVFGRIRYRILR